MQAARELHKLRSVHASQAEALQAAQERVAHEAAQHTAKQQTERQVSGCGGATKETLCGTMGRAYALSPSLLALAGAGIAEHR